ncbi:N-acyl-D-amino-acid deacylase family protein [Sphingomonas montanisoli]|uniref:Amidohydrolase family protein n=1 Tax=Sphingomonas montanisoli TaxID=2606412 RepID=A0A5D9BZ50_9SPHN|nr:amidohydrolase family protein [Sphingomonas montanisoli]TZG24187.1 amidohydrolase family protein [Sphingomonas montanisoli]
MKYGYLIRGGTVVDGTGAPAFQADVRVVDGMIAQIGKGLEQRPRERVFDAAGCYVTPGFVETHNHFDAPMWWMPMLEPMAAYGVTTSINGNCGFAAAPCSDNAEDRLEMVKIFSFFEDIPIEPFLSVLPWDWRKWSEYRASIEKHLALPVNFGSFCGHIALRLAVVGKEAWERPSTKEEIAKMCALLEDALDAGALGLSSNMLDWDQKGRAIPSITASDEEWSALVDVLARYPGKTMQVILGNFIRYTGVEDMKRLEAIIGDRDIKLQWLNLPPKKGKPHLLELYDMHARYKAEGRNWVPTFATQPLASTITFYSSLVFGQAGILVWHELIEAPTDEAKTALLEDPAWRARARESWDNVYPGTPMSRPEERFLQESETGIGPVGISLAQLAADTGLHVSDALAEWLLANGFGSVIMNQLPPMRTNEEIAELMADPQAICNVTDAGAHGQMLCGIGNNALLLTTLCRDGDYAPIELVVHNLTGKLANWFGLIDRGEIKVGKAADIAVFNLDEIEQRPIERTFDVPDGKGGRTWRYTRAPAPMRLTMVNGTPTYVNGRYTGQFPGQVVSPMVEQPLAQAAE